MQRTSGVVGGLVGMLVVSVVIGILARLAFPATVGSTGVEIAVIGIVFLTGLLVRIAAAPRREFLDARHGLEWERN